MNVMDRLYAAVKEKGNVCVGLDTAFEYIPPQALQNKNPIDVLLNYNEALIEACFDYAACFKVQIAYYESLGIEGLKVYAKTIAAVRKRGGIVIADIKRGDIADTARRYAEAHFSGDFEADIVTLNPYMGMDTLEPWLLLAQKKQKGAFVLLRTSNKGFADFEGQRTESGAFLYQCVGDKLSALAEKAKGEYGYGIFGAVCGAETKNPAEREEAAAIRLRYQHIFFLIPGYGAQGGGAAEAALLLNADKNGGVVNASRSLLCAWKNETAAPSIEGAAQAAANAAKAMRNAIRAV